LKRTIPAVALLLAALAGCGDAAPATPTPRPTPTSMTSLDPAGGVCMPRRDGETVPSDAPSQLVENTATGERLRESPKDAVALVITTNVWRIIGWCLDPPNSDRPDGAADQS